MIEDLIELLFVFQNAAGAWQRQKRAERVYENIARLNLLTEHELNELHTAWAHAQSDEGRAELDEVCKKLILKYHPQTPQIPKKKALR